MYALFIGWTVIGRKSSLFSSSIAWRKVILVKIYQKLTVCLLKIRVLINLHPFCWWKPLEFVCFGCPPIELKQKTASNTNVYHVGGEAHLIKIQLICSVFWLSFCLECSRSGKILRNYPSNPTHVITWKVYTNMSCFVNNKKRFCYK